MRALASAVANTVVESQIRPASLAACASGASGRHTPYQPLPWVRRWLHLHGRHELPLPLAKRSMHRSDLRRTWRGSARSAGHVLEGGMPCWKAFAGQDFDMADHIRLMRRRIRKFVRLQSLVSETRMQRLKCFIRVLLSDLVQLCGLKPQP